MALVCLIFVPLAVARRSIGPRAPFDARRILWIAAHPDDELMIAPLLGRYCIEGTSRCSLLVTTRGENGPCELPGGCSDLGAIREQEMRSAAALFHASLTQWSLPDVMSDVAAAWGPDIVTRLRQSIVIDQPTVVITFDPSHGSTCHPAHRPIGALVLDAIAAMGSDAPGVFLVETRATLDDRDRFANGLPDQAITIDARGTWHDLTEDAALHTSQFSNALVGSLAETPDAERFLFVAPASKAGSISDCH
ncbi:MAG TPA: PIG-L family deacetylase [Thermoanaerobaculia bacterium]|nr:PIG-L family deacetylase [Thermoanaerobaculia bacterium]